MLVGEVGLSRVNKLKPTRSRHHRKRPKIGAAIRASFTYSQQTPHAQSKEGYQLANDYSINHVDIHQNYSPFSHTEVVQAETRELSIEDGAISFHQSQFLHCRGNHTSRTKPSNSREGPQLREDTLYTL